MQTDSGQYCTSSTTAGKLSPTDSATPMATELFLLSAILSQWIIPITEPPISLIYSSSITRTVTTVNNQIVVLSGTRKAKSPWGVCTANDFLGDEVIFWEIPIFVGEEELFWNQWDSRPIVDVLTSKLFTWFGKSVSMTMDLTRCFLKAMIFHRKHEYFNDIISHHSTFKITTSDTSQRLSAALPGVKARLEFLNVSLLGFTITDAITIFRLRVLYFLLNIILAYN